MLLYSRDCVRTSSLNPMERGSEYEGKKLELDVEVVPSAKQAVEEYSAVDSTDVPIVSVPIPCLSNTISQEMDSGCEDAKDVEMADSEASSSALTDLEIHGSRCYNNAEGSPDLEISEGQISEVSSSDITEPNSTEPELSFQVSEVEDKDVAVQSKGKQHAVINSVGNKIEPYSNGVCENGVADNSDTCATLNTGEVLNDSHLCGKAEKVEETGKDMLPSQITAVGAVQCNGRNSLVSKPKPLFASGFLEKRPPKKHSEEEVKATSSSRKQFVNSEDGATSKCRDSYIPPTRSSGSIHVPCDSLDIGEETFPVSDGIAVNSTTAVVLNEAHCFNTDGEAKKLEIEKGSLSLPVSKSVSAGGKDGRKFLGSKSKPLLRPGFLGKHPREKYSKQEAVVPADIGNASFNSACKLNGISHKSTGVSSMGDSEDGESYIGNRSSSDI